MSVVISLCDLTGHMVQPWVEAGYDAVLVDPQHGVTRYEGSVLKFAGTVEDALEADALPFRDAAMVFGFPPCTDMAVSGARWFAAKRAADLETNWGLEAPRPCNHDGIEWWAGAYGGARRDKYEAKYVRKGGYVPPSKDVVKALLGVEHDMTWNGLFECLPPAYTEWVGTQLAAHISKEKAA